MPFWLNLSPSFLATLLLLLAVSCAIIIRSVAESHYHLAPAYHVKCSRSFVLCRRFRRRIEEAIAAGVLIPGSLDGGLGGGMVRNIRRHDFGEKLKLWE
jgi:hypothetical protein